MNIISPLIIDNLSRTLARATAEGLRVSPRGGNSTQEKFLPPFDVDLNIDLTQLNHVVEYEPANLTVTVEAGMTLAALQDVLCQHKQFLPLDPPQPERATLGGIIASNASGPLRLRYGTVRDWLIGVRVVMADGTVVRGGGKVVKNVAGYDLPKLFVGSCGTLGVVAEATFKLSPLPPFSRTLVAPFASHTSALNVLVPLLRSTLLPSALELFDPMAAAHVIAADTTSFALVTQFAGTPAAVERQTRDFTALCAAQGVASLDAREAANEHALWARARDLNVTLGGGDATLCELRLLPSQLDEAMTHVIDAARERAVGGAQFARAAHALWVALVGDDAAVVDMIAATRAWVTARNGYLVVQRAPAAVKARVDVWGPTRSDFTIMQRIKAQFDPQEILNPGVFVGGM